MASTAQTFYALQLASTLSFWLLVCAVAKRLPHVFATGSVYTVPHWLPSAHVIIRWLSVHHRHIVFFAFPSFLTLGALFSDALVVRLAVALAVSVYHLTESAFTSRHGEYPVLYICWAMCIPGGSAVHSGAALGVAIHFVLSSGAAKLRVGGLAWARPHTMRTYLELYRASASRPPLSRRLSAALGGSDVCAAAIAIGTLLLECIAVPGTLLLPPDRRILAAYAMIALHAGIALTMSREVGLVFISTVGCYLVGFACEAPSGDAAWWVAAAVGLLPSLLVWVRGRPWIESWPYSACALFMFNGPQADTIARLFMTGQTRLILFTEAAAAAAGGLVGRPVAYHGLAGEATAANAADGVCVHDAVLRVVGFTLLHREALPRLAAGAIERPEDFGVDDVRDVEAWLRRERRLFERASGEPLARAALVRVDQEGGRVAQVLLCT